MDKFKSGEVTMTNVKVCLLLLLHFALVSFGKADCPLPELNGSVLMSERSILQNRFPDNSPVFLECANGYERESGSDSIVCTDGKWSDVELTCKKVNCGQPKSSPHMNYNIPNGTLFGAYAKPTCEKGYYLEGSSYRQCLVTGWSGRSKCSLITCEQPPEIEHGMIVTKLKKEDIVLDDVIEYSCDPSYALIGERFITCDDNGEYSASPPKCEAIKCQVPEVTFGIQIEGIPPYSYKSEARFTCEPGYSMKGSSAAVCEERGWSELPVCLKDIAKETTGGITPNIPTTTTKMNGREEEKLGGYSLSSAKKAVIIISVFCAILLTGFCVLCLVHRHYKHKGSYDTGEELRTKEELLQYQSL